MAEKKKTHQKEFGERLGKLPVDVTYITCERETWLEAEAWHTSNNPPDIVIYDVLTLPVDAAMVAMRLDTFEKYMAQRAATQETQTCNS